MASGPITLWQVDGEKVEAVTDFILWAPKSLQTVTAAMKLKDLLDPWKKIYDKLSHHFADKGAYSQRYGFSTINVQI